MLREWQNPSSFYIHADTQQPFMLKIASIKWNNGLVIRALDSQSKGGIFINIKQLYRHFSLNLQRMNIQRSVKWKLRTPRDLVVKSKIRFRFGYFYVIINESYVFRGQCSKYSRAAVVRWGLTTTLITCSKKKNSKGFVYSIHITLSCFGVSLST